MIFGGAIDIIKVPDNPPYINLTCVDPKSLDDLLVGKEFCGVMTFPDWPSTDCFWFSGLAAMATLLLFLSSSESTGADGVDAL